MRPVCEAPKYCKDDPASVYLGQPEHLLRDNAPVPAGFADVRHHWKGRCSYAGSRKGASALCQLRTAAGETWEWVKNAKTQNPGFICASGDSVSATAPTSVSPAKTTNNVIEVLVIAAVRNRSYLARASCARTSVPCIFVMRDLLMFCGRLQPSPCLCSRSRCVPTALSPAPDCNHRIRIPAFQQQ